MNILKKTFISFIILLASLPALAGLAQTVGFGLATLGSVGVYMGYATANPLAIGGGLAIGALGGAIYASEDGSTPTNSNKGITIQLDPNVPLLTPTGWSSPTAPPSTRPPTVQWRTNASGALSFDTPLASCQAAGATQATPNGPTAYACKNAAGTFIINTSIVYSCATGYTVHGGVNNGSVCDLQTATAVIKPESGRQEIKRSGNTFVVDAQAHPNDIYPTNTVSVTSTAVTVNTADGGKLVSTINTDGTSKLVQSKPVTGSTNTEVTTVDFGAPDGTGKIIVTGKSTVVVTGQGTQQTTTPAAPTTTGGGNVDVSSLNKEATQGQIKAILDDIKLNAKESRDLLNNESHTSTDLTDQKTDYDSKADAHEGKFRAIGEGGLDEHGVDKSFAKPMIESGTCSAYSMPINGHSGTIDFCNKTNVAKDILSWIFYALTAWGIFGIFTTKRE